MDTAVAKTVHNRVTGMLRSNKERSQCPQGRRTKRVEGEDRQKSEGKEVN